MSHFGPSVESTPIVRLIIVEDFVAVITGVLQHQ